MRWTQGISAQDACFGEINMLNNITGSPARRHCSQIDANEDDRETRIIVIVLRVEGSEGKKKKAKLPDQDQTTTPGEAFGWWARSPQGLSATTIVVRVQVCDSRQSGFAGWCRRRERGNQQHSNQGGDTKLLRPQLTLAESAGRRYPPPYVE